MFTFAGKQCVDPFKLYDLCAARALPTDLFAGKANRFVVNAGAEPSAGAVLMTREDFDGVDDTKAHSLAINDGINSPITFVNVYVVNSVRVVGGAPADPEGVYLVALADHRRRLAMVPISKAYNVRPSDGVSAYYSATRNGGSDWTWATMLADLWAAVGGLGTYPGLPSGASYPAAPPENFNFYGAYALPALVLALNRVGLQFCFDNTTGLASIKRIGGGTDSTYYASWTADKKFDGEAYTADVTNRPEKVRVRFVRLPRPTTGADPYYSVDVSLTASTGVLAGSVAIVDDDLAALAATGTPTNSAILATRAAERAADWERRYSKAAQARVVQYREYMAAARTAVGERRDAAVYEDTGDGYTTESFAVTSRLYELLNFKMDAAAVAASPVFSYGNNLITGGYTLTQATGAWETVGTLSLAASGLYLFTYFGTGAYQTNTPGDRLEFQLRLASGASFASGVACAIQTAGVTVYGTTAGAYVFLVSAATTLELRARRVFTGAVSVSFVPSGTPETSGFSYLKLL